jgi:hypothetical protein
MKIIRTNRFKKQAESDYNRTPSFGVPIESIMDNNTHSESEQDMKDIWLDKKKKKKVNKK